MLCVGYVFVCCECKLRVCVWYVEDMYACAVCDICGWYVWLHTCDRKCVCCVWSVWYMCAMDVNAVQVGVCI